MSVIIPRNTSIPTEKEVGYTTSANNQTAVGIKIFEGERKFTTDNHKLGEFSIEDVPPEPAGEPKVKVKF